MDALKETNERFCKICGKKLNRLSTKTNYCSVACVSKDAELLEEAKNLKLSVRYLSRKYHAHVDKVAAALSDTGTRKAYTNIKICPTCNKPFHVTSGQKHCSFACVPKKRRKTDEEILATRRAKSARRRAKKKNAYTEAANKNLIQAIYKNVPEGYEVDHIIPISKNGLHHQDNLQYLSRSENARKRDRLDYEPQNVIRWQDVIQLTEE